MSNNEKNNKNDGFGKGLTLIIIGVVALLVTFFDFEIDWRMMTKLWPLLLVIIGVCIMPISRWIRTVIVLVLLALGFVAYQSKLDRDNNLIDKIEIISTFSGDDYDDDDDIF